MTELTDEQRLALVEYQKGQIFHPFTCPQEHGIHVCLIPGEDAWFCPVQVCEYVQPYGEMEPKMALLVEGMDHG